MTAEAKLTRRAAIGAWLNLVVPGVGFVLIDQMLSAIVIGLLATVAFNAAVVFGLIAPEALSGGLRGLILGTAGGVYIGVQIRFAHCVRVQRAAMAAARHRAALGAARAALEAGDAEAAWSALEPIADDAADDLLIAVRVAQVLTAKGDWLSARQAWDRVARLDRHGIYRDERIRQEAALVDVTP